MGTDPHPPSVAVHRGDLLGTPSPRMGVLRLGSKKQQPAEDPCLHRLATTKDELPSSPSPTVPSSSFAVPPQTLQKPGIASRHLLSVRASAILSPAQPRLMS